MTSDTVLAVRDLSIQFKTLTGTHTAIESFSFGLRRGKVTAVVGESGSGKSVSAQAIMGILPRNAEVTRGEILLYPPAGSQPADEGPIDLVKLKPSGPAFRKIRATRMGMIFQEPMTSLSPLHTIGNQIIEAARLQSRVDKTEAAHLAMQMLDRVGFPEPESALQRYPFELSGGLRQRAMIAMALIGRPDVLIADEPTTALDVTIQAQILALIRDLQRELNTAVLMITHDLGVVANLADDVAVVYQGQMMERGPAELLYRTPRHAYLKALFDAVPRIHGEVAKTENQAAAAGVTHTPDHPIGSTTGQTSELPIMELTGVRKGFEPKRGGRLITLSKDRAKFWAVQGVDLRIKRGECLGLVGESGCGKTTLNKIMVGALSPDEGEVIFRPAGREQLTLHDLGQKARKELRRHIQYIFQDPFGSLNPRHSVGDILMEPYLVHGIGDEDSRRKRAVELMHMVGLDPERLSAYPHSFSGGQRQRIGIARALCLEPELILCDEPVSALDVSVQAQILNLLTALRRRLNLTLVFVSHNLAVVKYIADRIAVMCAGRIVEVAPRVMLFSNAVHPYTQALLAAVPEPDIDQKLDFDKVRDARVSEPQAWPGPFAIKDDRIPALIETMPGHFVRMHGEETP